MIEADLGSVVVRPIVPAEEGMWDSLMSRHHYLGFNSLVGNSLKYVALLEGQCVALLGWAASAFMCAPRDRWIGWSREQQWSRLRYVVNNQRFLILPGIRVRNLASRILALNARRLSADWEAVFGYTVVLAETFVDHNLFSGTCYRAAGWQALGRTRGFGRNGQKYYHHGRSKTILVRQLRSDARDLLTALFNPPDLRGTEGVVNLNKVSIRGKGGLWDRLNSLKDPRKRRGIRHNQVCILAVAICAVLAGARSFCAIGEWAQELSQKQLQRLGCRFHEDKKVYIPPSEPTIRRMLQTVNAGALDRIINEWLAEHGDAEAVAVDGKTLRGARREGGRLHLMSALLHKQGVVVSQKEVDSKTNEISVFEPLLDSVDLEGKVVTADAMHAQKGHATYLVEKKKADYLFTVKRNQRGLLADMEALEEDDFSPSAY